MIAGWSRSVGVFWAVGLTSVGLWLANVSITVEAPAGASQKTADAAIPVVADVARRADVPVYVVGLGTVAPLRTVIVTSRIEGELVRIDFADGQDVHAGDLLAEIDPRPLQAALEQTQATKVRDKVLLDNAELEQVRAQTLTTKGFGSTQILDTAKATVAQLEAAQKVDQAAIDIAQVQLEFTRIRSPLDGRTGIHLIDAGNIIRSSDTGGIVRINQIHPIAVDFSLPSNNLALIQEQMKGGQASVVVLDDAGKELGSGRLSVVDNQINGATSTIRIRAVFDNADDRLWPGQFVNVRVQVELRRSVVTIPATAVVRGPDGTYAFVISDDKHVIKRSVTVGHSTPLLAVVDQGIQPGETVITDGQYRVEDGALVDATAGTAPAAN
jgi:multidrug efflux system membrane fusion protein